MFAQILTNTDLREAEIMEGKAAEPVNIGMWLLETAG